MLLERRVGLRWKAKSQTDIESSSKAWRVHALTSRATTKAYTCMYYSNINEKMPICIECRFPVSNLYTTYSKADDKALGKGVRLTQCPQCKRFADKYVEHDFVVLFIDLVLIKPQV